MPQVPNDRRLYKRRASSTAGFVDKGARVWDQPSNDSFYA
jgi:hypothetical protein